MSRQRKRQLKALKVKEERLREEARARAEWERVRNMQSGLKSAHSDEYVSKQSLIPKLKFRGQGEQARSVDSGGLQVGSKKEQQVYTGTAMRGVATMHKSNAVPVFSEQDAIDIAKMRR